MEDRRCIILRPAGSRPRAASNRFQMPTNFALIYSYPMRRDKCINLGIELQISYVPPIVSIGDTQTLLLRKKL